MADHVKILVVDPNVGALTALRDSLSFAADLGTFFNSVDGWR